MLPTSTFAKSGLDLSARNARRPLAPKHSPDDFPEGPLHDSFFDSAPAPDEAPCANEQVLLLIEKVYTLNRRRFPKLDGFVVNFHTQ
jgi:hypothetical protein